MGQLLGPDFPGDIGLAVSGGGDSMAMLYLAHNWTRDYGVRLWIVTVDHGLRAESAAEADMVAQEAGLLGWPHATLRWAWDGAGNLQNAAREARLTLIDAWRGHLRHVLFAHTQDDQAETVLMRLARGSGVDGLAGMRGRRIAVPHPLGAAALPDSAWHGTLPPRGDAAPGFELLRPCLGMSRQELRHYARVLKGRWVEDTSNDDPAYDRVRVRKILGLLREEGVTTEALAETAARMARARDGLNARLADAVKEVCKSAPTGQVRIDRDGFAALDRETQLRLLTAALRYAASEEHRPRSAASEGLLESALSGGGGTLHGAELSVEKAHLRIFREPAAASDRKVPLGALWDGQWVLKGDGTCDADGVTVGALGQGGWEQITQRGDLPVPHRAARGLPAAWRGERLLSVPALGIGTGLTARRYVLGRPDTGFEAFCLSH
nr:tRNA lysidine(34) synthetase TilS [Marivita sp. GX14005]